MNKLKNGIILTLITIFFFEIISFIIFKFNLLEISHIPKIYMSNSQIPNDEWWIEKNRWGAWHKKNSLTTQKRSCFDVAYQSNEYGARDSSFNENSLKNIILIGDSFAEGYGVNYEDTSQKYLEDLTNSNILNFGVSKNFGIVQYYIIYKNFAKKFKHNKLIIYFLPNNDFGDNDYNSVSTETGVVHSKDAYGYHITDASLQQANNISIKYGSSVGRHQIPTGTILEGAKLAGLSPTAKFNKENQDKIFYALFKKHGVSIYDNELLSDKDRLYLEESHKMLNSEEIGDLSYNSPALLSPLAYEIKWNQGFYSQGVAA